MNKEYLLHLIENYGDACEVYSHDQHNQTKYEACADLWDEIVKVIDGGL